MALTAAFRFSFFKAFLMVWVLTLRERCVLAWEALSTCPEVIEQAR